MRYFFLVLWLGTLIFAFWRGGKTERLVALIYASAFVATQLVSNRRFVGVELGTLGVDALMLIALLAVTMRFQTRWLIWTSVLQLVTIGAHIARAAGGSETRFGYAWVISATAYPMLVLLAGATWRHSRAARANGI